MPASLLSKLAFWSVCSLLLLLAFLRLFPCFAPALCATLEPPALLAPRIALGKGKVGDDSIK
jgi:hypothetical protein